MVAKHSRHIALTAPLAAEIDSQVEQGRYASASEMVRVALRLLIEHDEVKTSFSGLVGASTRQMGAGKRS